MNLKRLLIAVVLLAGLGGGVYWSNKSTSQEAAKKAMDSSQSILGVTDGEITKLEIVRKDSETTALVRTPSNDWKVVKPFEKDADMDAVHTLLTNISTLKSERTVEEKPADLTTFGLKEPSMRIVVTLKSGKTRTLLIGDDLPVSSGSFVSADGDPKVLSITGMAKADIDKRGVDLRDRRLLPFDANKLTRIELTLKAGSAEFTRNAQNEWALTKPVPARADNWQVEELLRTLREARLDATLTSDQEQDLVKMFNGATPAGAVTLTSGAGAMKLELRRKEDKVYAKSSVVEGAHLLTAEAAKPFEKTAQEYRNKKVFDFGFSDPTRIEFKAADFQIVLTKAGDRWLSNNKQMDSVGVQSLIDRLRELSATGFPAGGFSAPSIEVVVVSKATEKLSLAKSGDKYIAQRAGETGFYELPADAVEQLRAAAHVQPPPAKPAAEKAPAKAPGK
jgi:hypothetical protein